MRIYDIIPPKKKIKQSKLLSILLVILLLVQILGGVLFYPPLEEAYANDVSWYNSSWLYRKPITIDNTGNANDLTNYQVKITLSSSNFDFSKAQSNGEDLRFTNSNGTTLFDYWIESYDNSGQTAIAWVEISSISASSTKTIYIYYGNSSASSASNGDNTFVFFDDFSSDGELSAAQWDDHAESPVFAHALGSVVKDGDTYYLYYDTVYGGTSIAMATSTDGINFTDATSHNPILSVGEAGEWDDHHIGLPYVWKEDTTFYMAYRGDDGVGNDREGGLAYSSDGYSWTKIANNPYLVDDSAWVSGGVEPWGVIKVGDTYYQYYSAFGGLTRRTGVMTTTASPMDWSTATFTQDANNPIFGDYYRCMDVFKYGSYYYAIPTYRASSDSGTAQLRLFRDTSPTFYSSSREYLGVVKRCASTGWNSYFIDMPYVITDDINRDSFPNNELWVYYSGEETDPNYQQGLIVETDIDAALQPSTSKWDLSEGGMEVSGGNLLLEGTSGTRGLAEQNTNHANVFQYVRVRSRFEAKQARATYAYPLAVRTPGSNDDRITLYGNDATDDRLDFRNCKDGSCTTTGLVNSDIQTPHTWELLWKANEVKLYQDDTLKATHTTNVTSESCVVYFREGSVDGEDVEVDWVFVGEYSSPEPSTTLGSEEAIPLVPTISTPSALSSTSIRWNFTDNADNETGFRIYDNTDAIATSSATADLSYLDETDLSANTSYTGRYVKTYNSYGESVSSSTAASIYTNIESFSSASWDSIGVNSITLSGSGTLSNLSSGTSGLYFENTTASTNSGWTQTNSWTSSSLAENTQYTFQVTSRNGDSEENSAVSLGSKYTLADTPTNFTATKPQNNAVNLSVGSFTNATAGSSGYYFYRSGGEASHNSGWIQTNSWQDTDFDCNTNYTWYVKHRNGDGTETSAVSVTSSEYPLTCGGGGLSPGAYNPPTSPVPTPENPEGGFKVLINEDKLYTESRSRKVTLTLFAGSDTKRMAISNNPDFSGIGTGQISYQSSYDWDLCYWQKKCPSGAYIVYVKFYTQWGQSSEVVSDMIVLKGIEAEESAEEMTVEEIKAKILEIQKKIVMFLQQLIQLLQEEISQFNI